MHNCGKGEMPRSLFFKYAINGQKGLVLQILRRWMVKLVERLLATAALWVQIQTSLKNTKWAA
jgi:hypothetical protein